MIDLHPIPADSSHPLTAHARTLFTQYRGFLSRTQSCNTFNFARYDEETATLPATYADHHGEILLALVHEIPAACIAWRDALTGPPGFIPDPTGRTAEIKRLFVAEPHRGLGLARRLVTEALARISRHRYNRIVLDTDHIHMPAALALYRTFGFTQYAPLHGNITFLHLHLPGPPPA